MIYILGFIGAVLLLFILLFLFCTMKISSKCSRIEERGDKDEEIKK